MKKLLATLTTAGALAFCGQALAADHTVKMLDAGADGMMVFEPGYLKVAPGDTVTFEAVSPTHNTTSKHVPDGGVTWQGQMGESIKVTFDKEGVYLYECTPHVALGMVGVIQVGNASNLDAAKAAAEQLKGMMALGKERLDKYLGQVN